VAAGDVNGDGYAEIIASAASAVGSRYRLLDLRTASEGPDMLVSSAVTSKGLFLAAGDLDGDGLAELVLGTGGGEAPQALIVDPRTGERMATYPVGATTSRAAARIALADVDADGDLDLFVRLDGGNHVDEYDGETGSLIKGFDAM
jgi:hypothetical protein